jgi:hypothetical protein
MAPSEATAVSAVINDLPTEEAFEATLPEMTALGVEELTPINIDVVGAVTTVLGCLAKLGALRSEIQTHLPTFDLERFDKLKQYALALNHANAIHRGTLAQRGTLAELGSELAEVRDRLIDDAESLGNHGWMDGERLKECKKAPGYRAIATDVFTLVALFKEHWAKVEARTPVTLAFLQQAGNRALELLAAVGSKEQAPVTVNDAQRARQQAYTLFARAYEDARRATLYLRTKEGEADAIAPSLYAGRGGRGNTAASPEPSGVEEAAKPSAAPASDAPLPPIKINNPHNLPIDSPFVS